MTPNEIRFYRARRARHSQAFEVLRASPNFPSVQIETHDRIEELLALDPSVEDDIRTEAKMDFYIKVFDIRAKALLRLVIDTKTHDAFTLALEELSDWVTEQWSGMKIWFLPPVGHDWRTQADRLKPRVTHWIIEGYKKLESLQASETVSAPRRGFRDHIRAWMQRKELLTVEQAAKALGVSESTLKSIMSDKGDVRYGQDTLKRVLEKTGYQPSGE